MDDLFLATIVRRQRVRDSDVAESVDTWSESPSERTRGVVLEDICSKKSRSVTFYEGEDACDESRLAIQVRRESGRISVPNRRKSRIQTFE